MKRTPRRCRHCLELFAPDCRNRKRQRYCSKPLCRSASKKRSQTQWLQTANGRNYFSGKANSLRVKEWRKSHPRYWKRLQKRQHSLQDLSLDLLLAPQTFPQGPASSSLQDILILHSQLLLGLTSFLTGARQKDNIDDGLRRLILKGINIQRLLGRSDGSVTFTLSENG